jgi:hypothetical protein
VAIKNEDIYVGAVYVSLDGTKSWLDLILKMIKMKVNDCYIIKGVRKILVNGIEIKESNDIPSANLDSIIAVCVLDELGVFFLFKCIILSLLLCRNGDERWAIYGRRTSDGRWPIYRRRTRDGRWVIYRRRTSDGRKTIYGRRSIYRTRTRDGRRAIHGRRSIYRRRTIYGRKTIYKRRIIYGRRSRDTRRTIYRRRTIYGRRSSYWYGIFLF